MSIVEELVDSIGEFNGATAQSGVSVGKGEELSVRKSRLISGKFLVFCEEGLKTGLSRVEPLVNLEIRTYRS